MENLVKIAIPTNDGVTINPTYCSSRGFLVTTVRDGSIVQREMRWNLLSEMMTSTGGCYYNLADCDIVLLGAEANRCEGKKAVKNFTVEYTAEVTAESALKRYLGSRVVYP
jgi:hypothetical protein